MNHPHAPRSTKSRIFRSDEVSLGDRVIVRRALGNRNAPVYSDVTGHVVELDPLVVRPQEIGGFPSEKPSVHIADEEIYVIKRLSPRRIRNSEIRAVEEATAAAFPGIHNRVSADGQWLMRAGDGITERSNSEVPLGRSAGFVPVPIAEIFAFYREHNLPPRLLIPERIGAPAERLLRSAPEGQWDLGPEILVMTRSLADAEVDAYQAPAAPAPRAQPAPSTPAPAPGTPGVDTLIFRVDDTPDQEWFDLYTFRGTALPQHALQLLAGRIDGEMGFARLLEPETGRTVAITRATLTESESGEKWLGYSAVQVAEDWRRRGLATRLGADMLAWGASRGADSAYLQVISTNTPAISLYHKLGFIEHHRHRCATWLGASPQ